MKEKFSKFFGSFRRVSEEIPKTFCPLPWMHLSAKNDGSGRLCCEGLESVKDDQGNRFFFKEVKSLNDYFNCQDYKNIRLEMMQGKRPKHCYHCFNQEDQGVMSIREHFIQEYKCDIQNLLNKTNLDGSLCDPKILYLNLTMGNKCNFKCRMCHPTSSHRLIEDWIQVGEDFDLKLAYQIYQDKWYNNHNVLNLIREITSSLRKIFFVGGEPMIIKEHLEILKIINETGHAKHISLKYNSNQSVIPKDVVKLWENFKRIDFSCSIEAFGVANEYIRYPSKWKKLLKNIFYLDDLADKNKNIYIHIDTTLQAYNIGRIPQLLDFLRWTNFKCVNRFPHFIWVKIPQYLCPSVLPINFKEKVVDQINKRVDSYEDFFLNHDPDREYNQEKINLLRQFCNMILTEKRIDSDFALFLKKTKDYDRLRNQFVSNYLPELSSYFTENL